jgi:hypothetical protein
MLSPPGTDLRKIESMNAVYAPSPNKVLLGIAFALAVSGVFFEGCASTPSAVQHPEPSRDSDSPGVRSLRWLDSADPHRDLNDALARGDTRFVGVYGYTAVIPGVERSEVIRHGVRYRRGTSDALEGREHARLNRLAFEYARQYNETLAKHLKR